MTGIFRIFQAVALIFGLSPLAPAAAFGMGGMMGGAPSAGPSVNASMGSAGMSANGGNAAFVHGSPAGSSNPSVGIIEARQRDVQVSAEIDQARRTGKSVGAAVVELRRGEQALASNHAGQAMAHFDHAESDTGIHASSTEMGSYSRSKFGSVAAGGSDLSGALVH